MINTDENRQQVIDSMVAVLSSEPKTGSIRIIQLKSRNGRTMEPFTFRPLSDFKLSDEQ